MCTSCLFIYLYRTIQRRVDFFYVKDHLPKCFINLHFKDESSLELLNTSADKQKRAKYIKSVEESFRVYWRLLGCADLTGMTAILRSPDDTNESDDTRADYESIETKCRRSASFSSNLADEMSRIVWLDVDNWHASAQRIGEKNALASRSMVAQSRANGASLGGLRRMSKRPHDNNDSAASRSNKISFNITFLVVALFSFFTVIFIYFKYYKLKKPCIRINLRHNTFRRLENPSQIR